MMTKQNLERMKVLDKLLTDEPDAEKRTAYQAEFDAICNESEETRMKSDELYSELDEIIQAAGDLDSKDAKTQTLMTSYNDSVRKLYEREKSEFRRGDLKAEPTMMPLFAGNLDETITAYRKADRARNVKPPTLDYRTMPDYGVQYAHASTAPTGSYRSLFGHEPEKGGFADSGDFFRSILSGQFDTRLESRMITGTGSLGGIVVPEFLVSAVLDRALESETVRPRATVYPMTTTKISIPGFNSYSHTSNRTIGGFQPVWGMEASTQTPQDATMDSQEMETKYLQLFCNASIQLLSAASGFENVLQKAMSDSVSFSLDSAFISGTGAGMPRGLTNDPARLTVTRTSAATISYNDVATMFSRIYPAQLASSVWLANSTTIPKLLSLTTANGLSNYVVQDPATGKFLLLGKEIIFTEKLPALGNENDLMLADLSQYNIGLNPLLLFDKSNAPSWYSSMMSFRIVLGVDGQGSWTSPITPVNGATQSWLVGLK